MKKKYKAPALFCAALSFVLTQTLSVAAGTVAGREPSVASDQQVFDAAPMLPRAESAGGPEVLGIVLWVLVFLLLGAALSYMVANTLRRRRAERLRLQKALVKPELIISEAYKKKIPR